MRSGMVKREVRSQCIPAKIDQPRGRFNIIMSAISIKFAVIGYSWALITIIKSVF